MLLAKGGPATAQVKAQLLRDMQGGTKYWTYVAKARKVMEKCMYPGMNPRPLLCANQPYSVQQNEEGQQTYYHT